MAQKKAVVHKEKTTENQRTKTRKTTLKAVEAPPPALEESPKASNIGEALRNARRVKNEPMKEISAILRINEPYLKAIEAMDANNLPEQVYALGFVRSYAQHLGVDSQDAVNQFRHDIFEAVADEKKLPIPQHLQSAKLPTKKILWMTTLALLIALGLFRYFWTQNNVGSSLEQELSALLNPSSMQKKRDVQESKPPQSLEALLAD